MARRISRPGMIGSDFAFAARSGQVQTYFLRFIPVFDWRYQRAALAE